MTLPTADYNLTEVTSVTTRDGKGSPLTASEHDANLTNLKNRADQAYSNTVDLHNTKAEAEDVYTKTELAEAIGNINNELFYAPLKNNLNIVKGTGSITFTRADCSDSSVEASYIDRYGVLQNAAANTARFEENGLLIEGESENLLTYSEVLDNASGGWTENNITPTSGQSDPAGNTDAYKLADDSTNGEHSITKTATTATADYYAFSCFAKKGTLKNIRLYVSAGSGNYCYAIFDLDTATVYSTDTAGDFSNLSTNIKELADDWYRISISYNKNNTTDTYCEIRLVDDSYNISYAGGGDYLYVFGVQLEEKPFATSYIKTTSSAVTRYADICYATYLGNVPNILAGNAFSMSCEFDVLGTSSMTAHRYILATNYAIAPQYNMFRVESGSTDIKYYRNSSGSIINTLESGLNKLVVTVDTSENTKVYYNGVNKDTGIASLNDNSNPTSSNKIGIGNNDNGIDQLYGHIKNIRLYDFELSATEVALL